MIDKMYCNICGKEMWEQNGKYRCELCERTNVFGKITFGKCWKETDGKVCGRQVVEIPSGWWGVKGLPTRRTQGANGITICRTCKCNDQYYQKDKTLLSIAHLLAGNIISQSITYDELRFSWPTPFIDRI